MFISAFKNQTQQTADLLDILAQPKKAEALLKNIKVEQEKLAKLKKEVMAGQSLASYQKKIEKEIEEDRALILEELAIADITKKALVSTANTATTKAKKDLRILAQKQNKLIQKEKDLNILEQKLGLAIQEVEGREQEAQDKLERGTQLEKTYSNKLKDLKERMKGL